ncbi:MAG: hypothetical protein QOI03_1355, partial [Solirubrobacteraceae bacterium]|nr:hypothetical protein [Solirubrobacteraceae bacterium]
MKRPAPLILAALYLLLTFASSEASGAAPSGVATRPPTRPVADARTPHAKAARSLPRAPSGPPLTSGAGASADAAALQDAGSAQAQTDPLVSNGLGSPLCAGAPATGELPAESKRHCETSGFAAAAAPTGNYGVDVHIDTGLLGFSQGELLSIVQDVFIAPVWMAIVWAVHALVVTLEWCFRLDIIDSGAAAGIGAGLRRMLGSVTDVWLPIVLALASVAAAYNGLIRRRVADTIGQALLMAGMMAGGMWVSIDPAGTVGSLGQWANEASLGTLAAAAQGTPERADGALANSLASVFAAAVEAPWCYLEFGDVEWCRSTERLDPRLRAVGMKIASDELAQSGCTVAVPSRCGAGADASAKGLRSSAELLRSAQSNGALFLSLPANGPARNSINDGGSLLRALCGSSEATNCRGPTAAQAEFRTNGGTWPRVGGLLLILAGVVGMLLLLGFIAMRLLAAAIFSLLYLLLAPGMVLAPALGENGRAIFRAWGARLLGAVVAKLLFAFLLGVVLAILAILSRLGQLGWWTQWLLMSAFWWGAFIRRHQALGAAHVAVGREPRPASRSRARRVGDMLEARAVSGSVDWVQRKRRGDGPRDEARGGRA